MNPSSEREDLSLNDAATHVLEECRTAVPGMQALFGFQLIAVFSAAFKEDLSPAERVLHLAALLLVAIAITLVMAPAALHRQSEPMSVSRGFIATSSRLLMASMVPLAIGICVDVYVIARVILGTSGSAMVVATLLLGVFFVFWRVIPQLARRRRVSREQSRTHPPTYLAVVPIAFSASAARSRYLAWIPFCCSARYDGFVIARMRSKASFPNSCASGVLK